MFQKILIANRGETALRVIRACRELGIATVVAYADADRDSLPVHLADEAVCIGPAPASKSYLNVPNIISAAFITGAEAIHPGIGFLAEDTYFAEICEKYGITFIGPGPDVIHAMGDKTNAKAAMRTAGLAVIPGPDSPVRNVADALEVADAIEYPVVLKAAGGGGGRGIRFVGNEEEMAVAFPVAQAEAQASFGNSRLYLEKFISPARHIEVQILRDDSGNAVQLGERDCSIQRRYQKLIEESPSPVLDPAARETIGAAALQGVNTVGYTSAGTVEFLVDAALNFYFMEINCRLQVEHTVSEETTGIDIVQEQIRIAAGESLAFGQEDLDFRGHAIECRITSEDPEHDFRPESGEVASFLAPGGPGIRVDSHLYSGYVVPPHYDSLIAKIIAWAPGRAEAIDRMLRALDECVIDGVKTNLDFHRRILRAESFREGSFDVNLLNIV